MILMIGAILFLICVSITSYLSIHHYKLLKIVFTVCTWLELSLLWMSMGSISIWIALSFPEHERIPDANHRSNARDLSINSSLNIDFKKILSNERKLNAFVKHLSKESSIKILTSYIEFTQFQHFLILNNKVDSQRMQNDVIFADSVPLSHLLQASNDNKRKKGMDFSGDEKEKKTEIKTTKEDDQELIDFKHQVHGLWKKYIDVSSPNEISMSCEDRALLGEALGDCDKLISDSEIGYDQLFELLQICRAEMERF